MKNGLIKVLVVLGFALTFFLSCTDNPTPDYPDISHFISSSSPRLNKSSSSSKQSNSSSSSVSSSSSIFSSSSIASSSSSKPSSSSSMPSSSSSSAVPSSSSVMPSSSSKPCDGFVNGTKREHYGKPKEQFCDSRDGKKYVYVTIGGDTWMAENLDYNTGSSAVYHTKDTDFTCGRLYTWELAMALEPKCVNRNCYSQINSPRHTGMCPEGWHIPTEVESQRLAGNSANILKTTNGWKDAAGDNFGNGIDGIGFAARPCGIYDSHPTVSDFAYWGYQGDWWIAKENQNGNGIVATEFSMSSFDDIVSVSESITKTNKLSIRCVKDK